MGTDQQHDRSKELHVPKNDAPKEDRTPVGTSPSNEEATQSLPPRDPNTFGFLGRLPGAANAASAYEQLDKRTAAAMWDGQSGALGSHFDHLEGDVAELSTADQGQLIEQVKPNLAASVQQVGQLEDDKERAAAVQELMEVGEQLGPDNVREFARVVHEQLDASDKTFHRALSEGMRSGRGAQLAVELLLLAEQEDPQSTAARKLRLTIGVATDSVNRRFAKADEAHDRRQGHLHQLHDNYSMFPGESTDVMEQTYRDDHHEDFTEFEESSATAGSLLGGAARYQQAHGDDQIPGQIGLAMRRALKNAPDATDSDGGRMHVAETLVRAGQAPHEAAPNQRGTTWLDALDHNDPDVRRMVLDSADLALTATAASGYPDGLEDARRGVGAHLPKLYPGGEPASADGLDPLQQAELDRLQFAERVGQGAFEQTAKLGLKTNAELAGSQTSGLIAKGMGALDSYSALLEGDSDARTKIEALTTTGEVGAQVAEMMKGTQTPWTKRIGGIAGLANVAFSATDTVSALQGGDGIRGASSILRLGSSIWGLAKRNPKVALLAEIGAMGLDAVHTSEAEHLSQDSNNAVARMFEHHYDLEQNTAENLSSSFNVYDEHGGLGKRAAAVEGEARATRTEDPEKADERRNDPANGERFLRYLSREPAWRMEKWSERLGDLETNSSEVAEGSEAELKVTDEDQVQRFADLFNRADLAR